MTRLSLPQRLHRRILQRGRHVLDAALGRCTHTYAQSGEDVLVRDLLASLGMDKPTYLDVGAHHPSKLSNTYLLYLAGACGVCVEPDPAKMATLRRVRRRDICLNVGIGIYESRNADFYLFDIPGLNTFSKAAAERYVTAGHRIRQTVAAPLVPINDVMATHFSRWPNLVSMDVEGLELSILQTFDFARFRPEVLCIETLVYPTNDKSYQLIQFLQQAGYSVFADTMINTVFLRNDCRVRPQHAPWQTRSHTALQPSL